MKGKVAALILSLAVHAGAVAYVPQATAPVLDGGVTTGEVALGLGFDDLVAASSSAQPAPVAPILAAHPPVVAATQAHPRTNTVPVTAAALAEIAAKVPPVAALRPPAKPQQKIRATTPPEPPVQAKPAASAPKKQVQPTQKKAEKTAQRGNAKINARKGQNSGAVTGKQAEAARKTGKSKAKSAGDGALRSYQTAVLRKIARVPKRAAGGRGKALVGVTIAASGSIHTARIVKSSGHAGIDRTALAQIKRAGPFGPTPSGKPVKVVVRFDSKS